jgi:hypothetical protein
MGAQDIFQPKTAVSGPGRWTGHAIANRVPYNVIENAPSSSGVGNIVRLASGELLMTNTVSKSSLRNNKTTQPGVYLLRSKTHGQTWSVSEAPLPSAFSGHCPACSADDHGLSLVASADAKTVAAFFVIDLARGRNGTTTCTVGRASSSDGISWSAPTVAWRGTFDGTMPFTSVTLNTVVPLRDGSLVMFLTGATNATYETRDFGEGEKTWLEPTSVLPLGRNFAVRSADGLHFGAQPAWLDGGPFTWAAQLHKDGDQGQVSSPGRHCHSALSLTAVDCHSLGIYLLILLPLLSFSAEMTVSPRATGFSGAARVGRLAGPDAP